MLKKNTDHNNHNYVVIIMLLWCYYKNTSKNHGDHRGRMISPKYRGEAPARPVHSSTTRPAVAFGASRMGRWWFSTKKNAGWWWLEHEIYAFHIFLLENTLFSWRFTGKIIVHDPLNGKISESLMAGWWFKEHEWIMTFHILGIIIPTDFHIFQRGRYTTNQLIMVDNSLIFLVNMNDVFKP